VEFHGVFAIPPYVPFEYVLLGKNGEGLRYEAIVWGPYGPFEITLSGKGDYASKSNLTLDEQGIARRFAAMIPNQSLVAAELYRLAVLRGIRSLELRQAQHDLGNLEQQSVSLQYVIEVLSRGTNHVRDQGV
jgi:hypothetical protein